MLNFTIQHHLFEPWRSYHHPAVRQLAFCIASPNTIQSLPPEMTLSNHFMLHSDQEWQDLFFRYQPRLNELETNPQPLTDFLAQLKSTRLGLRFEMFLWFWLLDEEFHHFKLLGHSIQKIEGPITLGELDFLILNKKTQAVEHWEVALKYYLAEDQYQLGQWFGLNRSDRLEKKLSYFTNRQFQFNHALNYKIDHKFAVLKGQLFIPSTISDSNLSALPHWVNQNRRIGFWGSTMLPQFYRLERHEWIAPYLSPISHPKSKWWHNGLYHHMNEEVFYMFRSSPLTAIDRLHFNHN
ncbi:DUF1853 family protein [Acinetobacter nectaris]|uniref:DUF1853 family protein n=1 Tax=Acinetobacter nectaris TaxID=1219382 RepID=UPI001F26FD22|nr:DUF1853 family protein [Acinetobacter nectaris]MCF9000190.1 DUF1853 family protein [Acinetobacter nectaris]MCF9028427.1 DUF1853 family protein [Acinetobacter nectaris]